MVYLKNDLSNYQSDYSKKNSIENFTTFTSRKDVEEKVGALYDTTGLEKKQLSGTYTLDKKSMPVAALEYLISQIPVDPNVKELESIAAKDAGKNPLSAIGLTVIKLAKDQNLFLQRLVDFLVNSFEVSAQGKYFSIKFDFKLVDLAEKVFLIDFAEIKRKGEESGFGPKLSELGWSSENTLQKFIDRNPNVAVIISGEELNENDNKNLENFYLFNNIKFDIDFPIVLSPVYLSSFVNKEDESKASISVIPSFDKDGIERKSSINASVLKLNRVMKSNKDMILIIAVVSSVVILLILFFYFSR